MKVEKTKSADLTRLAAMLGVKRRWFGLEPDFLLRRRAWRAIQVLARAR